MVKTYFLQSIIEQFFFAFTMNGWVLRILERGRFTWVKIFGKVIFRVVVSLKWVSVKFWCVAGAGRGTVRINGSRGGGAKSVSGAAPPRSKHSSADGKREPPTQHPHHI